MKTLCLDARLITAPGIGRFLKNFITFFKEERRYKLVTLVLDNQGLTEDSILVKSPIYSLKEQVELPQKIPRCDLFFSPHFNIPLFPIRAKRRLTTIHDTYHLTFFNELNIAQRLYAKLFYNAAVTLSDHVTTVSAFSKSELLARTSIAQRKLSTILNCASPLFEPCTDQALLERVKRRYGLKEGFLLALNATRPHKNMKRLIEAYERLGPAEELVIVGKQVERLTFKKGVHRIDFVEDEELAPLYTLARAFIFPSLYEGFGFPPLEAMACGCPVIASREASLPEVCGGAVFYVNPYDVTSIEKGIEKVLTNPSFASELKERGFVQAQNFQMETWGREYLKIIDSLCSL